MTTAAPIPVETPPPAPPPSRGLRRLGAALTYRDFRILWIGALVSTCDGVSNN